MDDVNVSAVQRWGLGTKRFDGLLRFFTFSVLHISNYCANVSVLFYIYSRIHDEHGESLSDRGTREFRCYLVSLFLAHLVVGLYCSRLAWRDNEIRRYSMEAFGALGRVFFSLLFGLTQLMQLKIAYGKFTRRIVDVKEDSDSSDDEQGRREDATQLQARRDAVLESIIPWAFPTKCFEGMFEGCVFSSVLLYAVLKVGSKNSTLAGDWTTYLLITASGVLSFGTVGTSMLNFDYHLSPAVRKTCDHSIVYTMVHVTFRVCESFSRIAAISIAFLGCQGCEETVHVMTPFFILAVDYCVSLSLLLYLSAARERNYRSLNGCCGFLRRMTAAMISGFMLEVANLVEFVDEAERGALKQTAKLYSRFVRILRGIEILSVIVFMFVTLPCRIEVENVDNAKSLVEFLAHKHKILLAMFILCNATYYSLLYMRFYEVAMFASELPMERQTRSTTRTFVRYLDLPEANPEQADGPSTSSPTRPQGAPESRASPLLGNSSSSSAAVAQADTRSSAANDGSRQVVIAQTRDEDLPLSLRADLIESGTWYHDANQARRLAGGNHQLDYSSMRAAPSLPLLIMSRGVHQSVADLLSPIDENEVLQNDSSQQPQSRVGLSDYEVGEKLGAGAYAPVFKCKRKSTGEVFAMKRLTKNDYVKRSSSSAPDAVKRERDTLCFCGKHPNVASLEIAFETKLFWVLITEFCDLGSLGRFVRRQGNPGLSVGTSREVGLQILKGLGHLHSCSILHRDVKPDNIGVCGPLDSLTAKLLDFGFAKRADARQSRTIVGSNGYVAPEIDTARQIFGALRQAAVAFDVRADLYSFGIVLFVVLVGTEASENNVVWNHQQFQSMLYDPRFFMWTCPRYIKNGIKVERLYPELKASGALACIKELTRSNPKDRPKDPERASRLPFFVGELLPDDQRSVRSVSVSDGTMPPSFDEITSFNC